MSAILLETPNSQYISSFANVCSSTLAWFSFYVFTRVIFPGKSPEWCNRFVTIFHGVAAAIFGVSMCIENAPNLFENSENKCTEHQHSVLLVSMGYFLYDICWCTYYNTETKLMMFHHVCTCFANYRMLMKRIHGVQAVCGLGGLEVSNPLLQLRWFLRTEGYQDSKAYLATELVFAILFFLARVIFGTYYFVAVTYLYPYDVEFRIYTTVMYFVSLGFLYDIVKYSNKKYFGHTAVAPTVKSVK